MRSIHNPRYLEFIARLRRARKACGLTQRELAERLARPQSFVSKVETCERRLDLIEAAAWCVAVGVAIDDVLPTEMKGTLRRGVGVTPPLNEDG